MSTLPAPSTIFNARWTNKALLSAARGGNREALEHLLSVSRPWIRRMAQTLGSSNANADDVAQETLWLVYRHIGALRELAAFPAWLCSIVRRERWRQSRRGSDPNELELDVDPPSRDLAPDFDLRRDLAAAIGALPPMYRQVLILRDLRQQSTTDVASALELTPAAVKSRLHRARLMVRERLGAEHWSFFDGAPCSVNDHSRAHRNADVGFHDDPSTHALL